MKRNTASELTDRRRMQTVVSQLPGGEVLLAPQVPLTVDGVNGQNGINGVDGRDGRDGRDGTTGAQGATGPRGDQGATGATGAQGATGPKGDTGEAGATGPKGDTGEAGQRGEQGATGPKGDTGEAGATGPQGATGATGPQGVAGPQGDTGATGPQGATGATGPQGVAGRDGRDGRDGSGGHDGVDMISTWTLNGDETAWGGMRLSISDDCPKIHRVYLNLKDSHENTVTNWKNYLIDLLALPNASDISLNFGNGFGDTATFTPACVALTHCNKVIQITGKFTSSTGTLADIANLNYETFTPTLLTVGIFVKGASSLRDMAFKFSGTQNVPGGLSIDTSNYVAGKFPYNATIQLSAYDSNGTKTDKYYALLHSLLNMPNDSDLRIDLGDSGSVNLNFTPTCAETNCHGVITIHGRINSQSCPFNNTDLSGVYDSSITVNLSTSLKGSASTNSVLKWNFSGDACHPGGMRIDQDCQTIFIRVNKIDADGNDNCNWKNWLGNLLSLQDTTHILMNIGDGNGNSLNARPTCVWTCDTKINIHAKVVSKTGSLFSDLCSIDYSSNPTMFVSVNVKGEYGVGTTASWKVGGPPCEPGYLVLNHDCELATLQINPQDVNFADKTEMFNTISGLLQAGSKIKMTISNGTTVSTFYVVSCKSGCQFFTLIGPKIDVHCLEGCHPFVVSYQVEDEKTTSVRFLESVAEGSDLLTTYPSPQVGDSVITNDTGNLWSFSEPGSIKFDQCGSQYLTVGASSDFYFAPNSFCIEGWIYIDKYSGWSGTTDTNDGSIYGNIVHMVNSDRVFSCAISEKGFWRMMVNHEGDTPNHTVIYAGSDNNTPLPVRTWAHFAMIRDGDNLNLFINGFPLTSTSGANTGYSSWYMGFNNQTLGIGADSSGATNRGNYQLSNLRISNGASVYSDNPFAVPTTALTNLDQTVLRLSTQALSTAFTDSSGTPKTITNVGGATFSSLGPHLKPRAFTNVGHIVRPSLTENFMVGIGDTHTLAYSYNGISWLASSSGTDLFSAGCCISVAWNGTIWVAVGGGTTTIAYSSDGINWTAVHCDPFGGNTANGVAWNGSKWITVGTDGSTPANTVATSYDGLTWCLHPGPFTDGAGLCVATNGTLWVAGGSGSNRMAYSVDGINWTPSDSGNGILTCHGKAVAWNGTTWVAGGSGSGSQQVIYSMDGINWSTPDCPGCIFDGGSCNTVAWNGSLWLVGGQDGNGNRVYYSRNGRHWTSSTGGDGNASTIFTCDCKTIGWNGTVWVAGGGGDNHVAYSVDGKTWTVATSGNTVFSCHCKSVAARRPVAPLVKGLPTTVSSALRGPAVSSGITLATPYYCLPGAHPFTPAGLDTDTANPPAFFEVMNKPVFFTGFSCALDVALGTTDVVKTITLNAYKSTDLINPIYTALLSGDSATAESDPGNILCAVGDKIIVSLVGGGINWTITDGKNLSVHLKFT